MKFCECCGEGLTRGDEVKVDIEEDLYFCSSWCAEEFYRLNPELVEYNGQVFVPQEFLVTRILATEEAF